MSYRELLEWQAYEQIEPFGRRRADVHAAMIVQTLTNAVMPTPEEGEGVDLEEVFPRFGESTREQEARKDEEFRKATERVQDIFGG